MAKGSVWEASSLPMAVRYVWVHDSGIPVACPVSFATECTCIRSSVCEQEWHSVKLDSCSASLLAVNCIWMPTNSFILFSRPGFLCSLQYFASWVFTIRVAFLLRMSECCTVHSVSMHFGGWLTLLSTCVKLHWPVWRITVYYTAFHITSHFTSHWGNRHRPWQASISEE